MSADWAMGGIISDPSWKGQLEACAREACAVAIAEGAKVDPEAILTGMMALPANMRSSMQKDVEQHKTPELDAIAGSKFRPRGIWLPPSNNGPRPVEADFYDAAFSGKEQFPMSALAWRPLFPVNRSTGSNRDHVL